MKIDISKFRVITNTQEGIIRCLLQQHGLPNTP